MEDRAGPVGTVKCHGTMRANSSAHLSEGSCHLGAKQTILKGQMLACSCYTVGPFVPRAMHAFSGWHALPLPSPLLVSCTQESNHGKSATSLLRASWHQPEFRLTCKRSRNLLDTAAKSERQLSNLAWACSPPMP